MQLMMRRYCAGALFALAMFSVGGSAYAQQPRPWEIGMQPAGGPIKAEIISLHSLLLAICWIIMILVGDSGADPGRHRDPVLSVALLPGSHP
jgi:cytochrome c oxidase subunit 2